MTAKSNEWAIMKIHYYNDTNHTVCVFVNELAKTPVVLPPQNGEVFRLDMEENDGVFIKSWPNGHVLISTYPLDEEE